MYNHVLRHRTTKLSAAPFLFKIRLKVEVDVSPNRAYFGNYHSNPAEYTHTYLPDTL